MQMDDFQNSIINLVRNSVNYNVTEFYSKETFPLQAWKKIMSEVFGLGKTTTLPVSLKTIQVIAEYIHRTNY